MTMDNKSLEAGETVSESNAKCAYDEKVVKSDENLGNLLEGVSKEQLKESVESKTNDLSQTPGHCKSRKSSRKESMIRGSPRVLRSRTREKPQVYVSDDAPRQDAEMKEKKRKKTKKTKKDHANEFLKIKTHLRYLLQRKEYEQNFIDAYVGEGWKGQSVEKIRPEKEIERAKSYIHRYKLKIRELFKRIDTSCGEGRIPESLYDSEGEIDSEDIFCAKCGQKDVRLDNDIILCDGACDRGFHQFCLDPPLLKEQVPPGDEGWLCPACDCKVDCVDLLNDYMGTDLSVEDSWEKVFPETAASGNKLDDNLGLPSDDSEDDDYNPDGPQAEEGEEVEDGDDEIDAEGSSSDESDFSSASEDLGAFAKNEQFLGLPSEDSDDDDFNPDRLDSDEDVKKESSSSDFTSASEDFSDVKNEMTSAEVQWLVMPPYKENLKEANMENGDFGPITAKRNVERLDYKKLHDETYGNISSDSSDEDFFDSVAPRRQKNTVGAKDMKSNKKQKQSESTPVRKTSEMLDVENTSSSPACKGSSDTNGNRSSYKRIGEAATQRLHEAFKENHYPDRGARENLVKELNLTDCQVSKWFENARWRFNHPEGHNKLAKSPLKPAENVVTKQANKVTSTTPKSRKRKTNADYQASQNDSSDQTTRRRGRVQAKRL
ncbi:hypothetical protein QVD17_27386 [Tagetes erecta]|uniref:Uncharacterized protein n=1 Tax=Tagetes erecta TaxID=13708 RepID=A0AAD8K8Z7_TARER|nr:hypothetical protein QVD17_27386 [Tagetes erecta]